MAAPLPSLAVIAGGGVFPRLIAEHARAQGTKVYIVRLKNDADDVFPGFDGMVALPEKLGTIFTALRRRGIRDLVLIGRMKRPDMLALRPDFKTLSVLPRILPALVFKGDDALLRAVRRVLEREGFTLHAAQDFMGALLAPAGVMGRHAPTPEAQANITAGTEAARALGRADTGQAVVARGGRVVGREGREGTDALIDNCPGTGSVLVKMAKPQQDRALDLPSIGPDTVRRCAEAGYAGIAVEAGGTLMANRQEMIDLADRHGLFIVGIT